MSIEGKLGFWRALLMEPPSLGLPLDRPRPVAPSSRGARVPFAVDPSTTERLRELAESEGATLSMVVLAAFGALLARHAGQDDVVVGSVTANTLPLRIDLSGDPTVRELLGRVRKLTRDAHEHELPLDVIIEHAGGTRDPGRPPLFDVRMVSTEIDRAAAMFDLTLAFEEKGGGLAGWLEYRTDLFDAATIERMGGHLRVLLEAMVADPNERLTRLPLLKAAELHQIVSSWNETRRDFQRDKRIHELFEAQVARLPHARAVEWEGKALSYEELNRRANRLAHALRARGVTRGSTVGLCLDRSGELVVGMLAVLKTGAAYVPLDATYPLDRLELMIEDVAIRIVITQSSLQERLPSSAETLCIEEDIGGDGRDDADLTTTGSTDDLAYVMYTSGSTGRPKGVCVPHRGIARLVLNTDYIDLGPKDRVAQASNAAFDAATFEIWGALLNGAAIVIIPKDVALSPNDLAAHLESARISTMFLTTALFNQVAALRPSAFCTVRNLLFGGEAVDVRSVAKVVDAGAPTRLLHVYGPTETTTFATWFQIHEVRESEAIPIGRPIANTTVYILDENVSPVPIGVAGEVYIGGEGVALGYWKRPDLTAEKFVPDPFGEAPGGRLYRTGDLARYRPDGAIEFVGRIDSQVKIRGFRIEPDEIRVALEEHAEVRAALVVVRQTEEGDKRLVGYVQPRAARTGLAQELREFLKGKLPDYMVPTSIVMVDEWPLTPNGKVDRKALPEPADVAPSRDYVEPRTPVEQALAGMWSGLLGITRVGVDDDFFELGGHSLLAMQVVARVRRDLGVELPVRVLFDTRSVAGLAHAIESKSGLAIPERIRPRVDRGPPPLSHPQQRLWFLEQYRPADPTYNVAFALRLERALDLPSLERALREIVLRHEILRTTYSENEGRPVQVIGLQDVPLAHVDLRSLPAADRQVELARVTGLESRAPFDLAKGPMLRACVVTLSDAEHVLLLTVHHIAFDGWSIALFTRELSALYEAFTQGQPSPLRQLELQYADFAAVERESLAGEIVEAKLAFWRELFIEPPSLALPLDRPRPAVPSSHGARLPLGIDASTTQGLRELARSEGATLFMVLLAAFGSLLGRHAGQDDVVVGSVTANRSHAELESLIGFFVNTLPLRVDLSGAPTVRELLRRVRKLTLDAYEHELPFDVILEQTGTARDPGRDPLFDALLVLQNTPQGDGSQAFQVVSTDVDRGTAMFDLTLAFEEIDGGLAGWLEYRTDLFDAATIARMTGHLQVLLRGFVAEPQRPVHRLAVLTDTERRELLYAWNETDLDVADTATIHDLFEAQVARSPDAPALAWAGGTMTYRDLNARANHLARRLQDAGIGPEALVGVCLERNAGLVVALLAVLKAGGGYVPLDPTYPRERLAFILEDAKVAVTLTDASSEHALPESDAPRWRTDGADYAKVSDEPNVRGGASTDNLAYLIYTSGSTGVPKGVAIAHRSVVALLAWAHETFGRPALAKVAACTSVCFDLSIFELFAPLTCGGQTVLVRDALALPELAEANDLTLINTVPSAIKELLRLGLPPSVRTVNLAGEPLTSELADAIYATGTVERVFDLYGPSEDTTYSTCALRTAGGRATIGRPISNSRLYLLDDSMEPVPVGVVGEIYLGGKGLARGYFDRASLTAERFGPDPFGAPGGRLYRTGDVARYLPDGRVQFLGRSDHQVKVRGFRIELGEIEAALRREAGVHECVVIAREGPGGTTLVGYVAPGTVDPEWLRTRLQSTLPGYMVPAAFVMLDALPLTANGKLDRKALPAPDAVRSERAYVAPRTPVEEILATIWCAVLRVERVGIDDNFFELGGHSLLATQVVARLRSLLRVEIPVRALFEAPTIARLAKDVEQRKSRPQTEERPLARVPRTGELPLSFAEARLWFLNEYEPGTGTYNIPDAVRLRGPLDEDALENALRGLVSRHESLRTRFVAEDGKPLRVIDPPGAFALERARAETDAAATELVTRESLRPFDLATGPLFRATLVRRGPEDHVLVLVMHHVVSDGWSMGVLLQELSSLYGSERAGEVSSLPDLAVQYADFAVWERSQGGQLEQQLAHWRDRLTQLPTLDLPTRPRPPIFSTAGATYAFELDAALTESLRSLSRREGTTLFMTLLAAFDVLLSRYSGQDDIVIGTPIAHRTRLELEAVVGFFVNTVVIRTDLSGGPTFHELLARVRDQALAAYANQDVPFERLVEELQPTRDMSRSPLFQVMFTLETPSTLLALPGLALEPFPLARDSSKFDLTLEVRDHADGMRGEIEYATSLFDASTIERMAQHYVRLLEAIVADPNQLAAQLSFLTEAEPRQLLVEWNGHDVELPLVAAHRLFERRAHEAPEALAVIAGAQSWSYGEINARANQLAHRLTRLGVQRGGAVALQIPRSMEAVVGILGILKTGAAYVPLDPELPSKRREYMVERSGARIVVSAGPPSGLPLEEVSLDGGLEGESENDAALDVSIDQGLAVLFTSGSTGAPKGVLLTHRGIVNYALAIAASWGLSAQDRVLQFASLGFDVSLEELVGAWAAGAALVLRDDAMLDPKVLLEVCDQHRVSIVGLPTAYYATLLELVESGKSRWPSSVRLVCIGGERAHADWIERFYRIERRPARLVNAYGPTEASISVTWCETRDYLDDGRLRFASPLGRVVPNCRVYVLDHHLSLVPTGVVGEICVGGAALARGYAGDPVLTAEAFVPHPFATGERLYRTGDLGRFRGDGALEFVGRVDDQLKIRGFRIEPAEIEAVLALDPRVAEAVVVGRETPHGGKQLVAYVRCGARIEQELRKLLGEHVPSYMVPAVFVFVDAWPLTPNGKVDRKALPEPEASRSEREYVAPRTPVEEILVTIWCAVLQVERVGIDDNFFELGGHSLVATQVIARVRTLLRVELPVRALFEAPTVRAFALVIEKRQEGPSAPSARFEIARVPSGALIPASYAQEGLLHWESSHPPAATWNISSGIRFTGPLDVAALERTLAEIIERHASLRTTFVRDGANWAQVISPPGSPALPAIDLRHLEPSLREEEAARVATRQYLACFALDGEPFFRAMRIAVADEMNILVLTAHQLVADVSSHGILFREIVALYRAITSGERSPLPVLPLGYADYAASERAWFEGGGGTAVGEERRRTLANVIPVELPLDRPRSEVPSHASVGADFTLSRSELDAITAQCKRESVTPFMFFLAAMGLLIQRRTGRPNVAIGLPMSLREHLGELRGVIGRISNLGICCFDVPEDLTVSELLARTRSAAFETYAHDTIPASVALGTANTIGSPLRRVMLNGPNIGAAPFADVARNGIRVDEYDVSFPRGAMNEITISAWGTGETMLCLVLGAKDLFDASTIQRMAADFRVLLLRLADAAAGSRISSLALSESVGPPAI